MNKQTLHMLVGSFVIGAMLGIFGLGINTLGYWLIFVPASIWYLTKPKESA